MKAGLSWIGCISVKRRLVSNLILQNSVYKALLNKDLGFLRIQKTLTFIYGFNDLKVAQSPLYLISSQFLKV